MELRRALGLPTLAFFGVGMVLGAGIYSVVGAAVAEAGEALWLSFLLGAVAALLTGLSYAELATALPRAGGEFAYVREAFARWPSLAATCGAAVVLAACATGTTVAMAFGAYLERLVPVPPALAALALLALATAVNVAGIREAAWINVAFTLLELAGLVLVIALGTADEDFGAALAARPTAGVLPAAALAFFAYLGFEHVVNLAEEARDPARDLPRALLLSVAVTGVLYVLVALAAVALAGVDELAGSASPLAVAAGKASEGASRALVPLALCATANTALATLVVASRVTFGMAREGELPRALARVLPGRKSPWLAALAAGALAAALLPLGDLALVAGLSSFGALVAFVAVNASAVRLRLVAPDMARPFRVPLAIGRWPVVPLLGLASCAVLLASFERQVHVAGLATLAVVAAAVAAVRRARR